MTPLELILSALLSLPVYVGDRDEGDDPRRARLLELARAVDLAAPDTPTRAALLSAAYHESRLARLIGAGRCAELKTGEHCDHGRARGYWQLWSVACPAAYQYPAGSAESLRLEADCAARHLRAGRTRCAGSWAGAFSVYRGGGVCDRPSGAERERTRAAILYRWSRGDG